MENMFIYNSSRQVPQEAIKPIEAGRLKGYSDINPMWRIKKLTELFGMVGIGWYYIIKDKQLHIGSDGQQISTVDIQLFVKVNNEWSMPIEGTGGSSFISKEKSGLYTNDECFKMALTDAISVACKSLGIGADIYYSKDKTKYSNNSPQAPQREVKPTGKVEIKEEHTETTESLKCSSCGIGITEKVESYSKEKYGKPLCYKCQKGA